MYGIIQDARKGKGISTLALVDRSLSKLLWWTSDNANIAICYESKPAAEYAAKRLRKNNARVVPFVRVQQALNDQRARRQTMEADWYADNRRRALESEGEGRGWDAHESV